MKKSKKIILSISILIILILAVLIIRKQGYAEEDAWDELMSLKSDVSMEDLKQKGYIDVSKDMDAENKEIQSFLQDAKNKKKVTLRIAAVVDDRLCAKILVYNKKMNAIVMETMYPEKQQAESPDKYFDTETYFEEENGVKTVYLKNIPNRSIPNMDKVELEDERLYSYKVK
ncbi:MAG: hypothetical protein Q4B89_02515 [Lachnospiraceae bacterium]|nr:hypothetical protein [Lachnospiraceae bacterium]